MLIQAFHNGKMYMYFATHLPRHQLIFTLKDANVAHWQNAKNAPRYKYIYTHTLIHIDRRLYTHVLGNSIRGLIDM